MLLLLFLSNRFMLLNFFLVFSSELQRKKKWFLLIKWKFLKVKIQKLNTLESIGEFIDVLTFYHLSKCVFKDCSNCRFIDRITQIYILFYPNYEREEENGSVVVKKLQKYFFKYFGNFYSLYIFLESIHILHEHEQHIEKKKKKFFSVEQYI